MTAPPARLAEVREKHAKFARPDSNVGVIAKRVYVEDVGDLLALLAASEAARREGERALEEERGLRVQLSDDSQRHLDRALEAERERDEYARGAIHYRDMAADYGKSMREATEALAQARAALEDSTAMLQGLRGTWANENGAIDEQIAENRRALLAPPEGTKA
jgi:hypothetical protein